MKELQKFLKKSFKLMLAFITLFAMMPLNQVKAATTKTMDFGFVTQVREYGQDVTHLIIDTGGIVSKDALSTDMFTVTVANQSPVDENTIINATRTVTNVYVNTSESIYGDADSGQYIVIEMLSEFGTAGAGTLVYSSVNYQLILNYTVELTESIEIDGTLYDPAEVTINQSARRQNLEVDEFEVVTHLGQEIDVYAPTSSTPLPLVLWNHGGGEMYLENGTANSRGANLASNQGATAWLDQGCYIVAPQRGLSNYSIANTMDYIMSLVSSGKVDATRIYVIGCSAGGRETIEYIKAYPDVFAAAVPICPAGTISDTEAADLVDLPIWFIHEINDAVVTVNNSLNSVANLEAAGSTVVEYTGIDGLPYNTSTGSGNYNAHWSWIPVLNNEVTSSNGETVFDWLFNKQLSYNTFELITQVEEYGQVVTHIIIDTEDEMSASNLTVDDFMVHALNTSPIDGSEKYNGLRSVIDVYVNNDKSITSKNEQGRYIVLALEYGYTVAGSSSVMWDNNQFANFSLNLNYTVTMKKNTILRTFDLETSKLVQGATRNLIVDDFETINYNGQTIRLFTPETTKAAPLVLWNHGIGERYVEVGSVNNEGMQLMGNEGGTAWINEGVYVLAPQRSYTEGNEIGYSIENTISFINKLVAEGKVDPTRIYVTGCSAGGGETYNYIRTYPSYFAAAVPICPAGTITEEDAVLLKDLPIWIVLALNDSEGLVNNAITSAQNLENAGATNFLFTTFEKVTYEVNGVEGEYNGHWSWIPTLNNFYSEEYKTDVFTWMFAQKAKAVDTTELKWLVTASEELINNGVGNITNNAIIASLKSIIEEAKNLLEIDSTTTTQAIVDEVASRFRVAYEFSKAINDLNTLVENAKAIDSSKYTAKTVAMLENAINEAISILAKEAATYEEVNTKHQNLLTAIDQLLLIEIPTTQEQNTGSITTSGTTNTGDSTSYGIYAVVGLAAVAGFVFFVRKRKETI